MAIYAELFDGTRLEFPDGTDPAVIDRVAKEETLKRQPKVAPPAPKESTILGEAKRGFQEYFSPIKTTAGAIVGSPEEAAKAGVARSEKIAEETGEGPSVERLKRVYEERGLLPAAGQVLSDIPRLLAQQGTQIAATVGGAKVGAGIGAAVAGPPGALIGGGIGAIGASVPSIFGQAMQRQAATQIEEGKPVDISMGRAAAATAGSAALEAAGTAGVLGKTLVKRLLGVGDDAALAAARSKEDLVKAARATIAGGAVRGAAVEMPVEVAQSVLDRWQAGLDVTGDDALKEYGESLYAAGLVGGPIGGASAIPTRRAAQRALDATEPLAPGQRRGETLEQTANRLNVEVQGLTGELQPPPPSPFLSDKQLASIAAEKDGYANLIKYEESIKDEPRSPEKVRARRTARDLRARLEIEEQQRQNAPAKPYPFDPFAPEPFQFKSVAELVDVIGQIDDPKSKLLKLLEYRDQVKAQPDSDERTQNLRDSGALYNDVVKFAEERGFALPKPDIVRARDLADAGIKRADPLYAQLRGKNLSSPNEAREIIRIAVKAQRRPDITPDLYDYLEGIVDNVEAYYAEFRGSGFFLDRTYPKPSGTGVPVAGQPEPTVPTGGAEPSGRMGMVGPTAPAEPTVSREKVAPAPVAPVVKPNYAEMTLEQLEAARDSADQVNLQLDLNAIRKYLGEDAAKKYEAMNRRARDNWWDKNATDALERESSVFQGVNEETIDKYIQAINNFDPTSPKDLGRSIALLAKGMDQPNFRGSPEFVTLRNALTFAKQQGWSEREVLDAMRGRAAEWAGADAKELFNSLFKSAPAAERKPAAPALPATQEPPPVPAVEPAYEPGLEVGLSERVQELEAALRKLEAERGQVVKLNPGPNLFTAVKGKLARSDVIDIGTDRHFRLLTNAQGRGTFVSELVNNSQLDVWLPPDKRPESNSYDAQESEEYIKDLLRNRDHIPFAVKETIDRLDLQIANVDEAIETETQLENLIRKANAELQIAAEERRAEEAELPTTGREVGSVKRAEKFARRAQLGKPEPLTIDVEARVIEETVGPQVARLPASQVALLEAHYGEKAGTQSFLDKVKEDVVLFANKGASAVAEAIRAVIKAIHAGVISVSLIFNPINISQPEALLIVPKAEAKTEAKAESVKPAEAPEVAKPKAAKLAQVPDNVEGMSDAARQAYQTLIPSLKDTIGDKLIVIADKPSARLFVFTPDGELVVQNKALFGAAKGDLYNGNVTVPSNRITPAGLFGLKLVDAKAGPSAKRTAGEYDFGKVFALEDPEAVITIMHSVWLKDSDAAMRQAALRSPDATDSRYSYGCINVDQATFKYLLDNYARQMDGAKMFVVPDNQAQLKEFLYGDIAKNIGGLKPGEGPDRLVREAVKRMSLAKVAPQVSEKKFQELERRAKQPSKPEPAKEEPEEVKAIRAERAEKISQLQGVLEKILAKYGLKDVKLNLEEGMKDEGSYEGQLIKLALNLKNPVQILRHEAIHALKELGFFTPQQWKVLTDRAKNEWIEKYLKNQIAIVDGKEVSRYDAYMDLYKGDQDKIVEEAIADAFGDFSQTKPPPGMMQAILTRMKNLFKAIKETFNQSGYQTAEDVFGKIEEGKLTKAEKLVEQVEAAAQTKLSLAPSGIPQKIWDLHEKSLETDKKANIYNYGAAKANATKASSRLIRAVSEYLPNDEQAQLALMVEMNEESTRREDAQTSESTSSDIRKSLRAPDTKEFDTFFGDSKIVDKDGEPKVMYHGTARDITSFVPKQAGAIFVTDDPNFAETFSKMSADWMAKHADQFLSPEQLKAGRKAAIKQIKKDYRADPKLRDKLLAALDALDTQNLLIIPSMYDTDAKEILAAQYKDQLPTGPNIMPVFVRAENPFDFDNPDHIRRLEQYEAENRYTEASIRYELGSVKHGSWEAIENRRVQDAIKQLGFDGFYVKEVGKKNLAVYSSNQIKSAIGNVGAFDVTDPDIRKSLRTRWSEDRVNSLLNKYAYTSDDNDTKAYAAFVRPEDFLNATSTNEYRQILETERTPLDVERLAAEDQEIYLEIAPTDEEGVYEIKGHEGRHRMMALQDAGVPSVPVVLVNRPYGRIKNATVVDEAYLKPQVFEAGKARRGISLREMIPINYAEAKNLKETFGGKADIKFSLRTPPTLPTDVTDRIKQTVIPRERPGMVGRLLDAISPRTFSAFRKEFVNGYDQLAIIDRQAAEQIRLMGGTEQLADAKAESAAHFSDLGGGLAASAMGVHDRVGGIPVYVRKYIVEKDFKKIGPDYATKAAAEAAAKKIAGAQVFEQGYTTISNANGVKGLIAIFSDLAKYKKPAENEPSVFDQYQFWADVKRASRFIQNPKTGGYQEKLFNDPDDIKRAKQIEQAFPEFVDIQKEWTKYNDGLVDFMRDTGVISEAGAKEMKSHGDYFPFYRHLGEDDIQGPRLFSSIANVKSVKAAKGSEAEVTDFFETIVRNTQSAIQSGIKNVAARRATDQAMRIKEVFKLNRAESGPSVYRVLEDGKETYYRAQDPLFIDALKVLSQPDLPFIGLLAGPAKLLRNLVTKDPAFQLANMMRDSLSAYVSSGYKFTPMVATLKQYGTIIAGKSPEFNALLRGGVIGGYDYSQGVEASAQKLEKEMRKVAGAKTTLEKIASPVTSLWGALEKSSEASDAATRNEIYKRVLAETGNEAEALYQALEVMNFNRKGRSPIIRILTAAVPFMNARIQGLDVLYRSGMRPIFGKDATEQEKARLKTFWVRGMTMMALSSMYWVLTSDDEEYKKQEQEVRDNYWLFPSLGIKIPIPFEIGVMFKVVPERILEYAFGSDTGQDFRKAMGRHLFSTFGFNPVPQAFLPAFEITVNHSFFTQRPIITPGMENISPEYQVGPNTSKIAGAIGQSLGISPIKLDYLIQGYTGTMGMYAVNLFDSIFSMNDEAPKPSRRLEQMPVLRRFMVDPEARGQITAYYDLKNSVDQVVRTSNYLERSMDFEQYGKYMQENIKMLSARDYISDLEKTMKEFREMKNLIRISKMDADEKRDSITNIGRLEQQLTQNIKTLKKQLAAQQ